MKFIDYYKTLEIDKKASQEEIKKAYRKLARKLHPDLNPHDKNANKRFQELNEANNVLSDPEKRKKYDQYGKDWEHGDKYARAKEPQYHKQANYRDQTSSDGFGEGDFSDFFASMFGNKGGGSVTFRGQDFQSELHLPLKEAYTTHQRTLTVNGKQIRITIPAGIENGQVIKLKGYGGKGVNGGPDGDLYITFSIANTPDLKRIGNDLYTTVTIDLYTAILGGDILLDSIDGQIKLKVGPETQVGAKVRLKGKGFPKYKEEGQFGDLYLTYAVKLPTHLNDKQKELFAELANLSK